MNNFSTKRNSTHARAPGREEAARAAEVVPLSTAHIRPQVIYKAGGSLLKTTKNRILTQKGGGKRGNVSGFSRGSRRRLMNVIAGVRRDAELPDFVTLTYPSEFPTVEKSKRDLKIFLQRLSRKFPAAGYIWKLEPQERGAPHFHMLVWGCKTKELFRWVSDNWYEIAGQGDKNAYLFLIGALHDSKPCVSKVRSWRGVWSYASKYLGKTFEVAEWGNQWVGRYWGIGKKDNIPFGQEIILEAGLRDIEQLMRYQRRYAHLKGRDKNSVTIYCDADQWIKKVVLGST